MIPGMVIVESGLVGLMNLIFLSRRSDDNVETMLSPMKMLVCESVVQTT